MKTSNYGSKISALYLQAANNWLVKNPWRQLVCIMPDDPVFAKACCNPAFLLKRQLLNLQLKGVEQKPGGLPTRNSTSNNYLSHHVNATPNKIKITITSNPSSSSRNSLTFSTLHWKQSVQVSPKAFTMNANRFGKRGNLVWPSRETMWA